MKILIPTYHIQYYKHKKETSAASLPSEEKGIEEKGGCMHDYIDNKTPSCTRRHPAIIFSQLQIGVVYGVV